MRLKYQILVFLLTFTFFKIISSQTIWIEEYYVPYIFKPFSAILRTLTSYIPFSFGLFAAYLGTFVLLYQLIIKRNYKNFVLKLSFVYAFYMISWGLLYYRQALSETLKYDSSPATPEELINLGQDLITQTNQLRKQISEEDIKQITIENTFERAPKKFNTLSSVYPFMQYTIPSIKPALLSPLLSYMGTSGIYTFWSGEANVNTINTNVNLSNVTFHEMGHQLGFASEDEANYIAWLVGKNSSDKVDQYAAHQKALWRTLNRIYNLDSEMSKSMYKQVDSLVYKDLEEQYKKWEPYENHIQHHIVATFYNHFLKANGKIQGSMSYDRVIDLIIFERRSLVLPKNP